MTRKERQALNSDDEEQFSEDELEDERVTKLLVEGEVVERYDSNNTGRAEADEADGGG